MALFDKRNASRNGNKKDNGAAAPAPFSLDTSPPRVAEPPKPKRPISTPAPSLFDDAYTPPPEFAQILSIVQSFLVKDVKASDLSEDADVRRLVEPIFDDAVAQTNLVISRTERQRMLDLIIADTIGYGPIQPLLERDDISEVMVNGPNMVYIEQDGKLMLTKVKFIDDEHVMRVIERIVTPLGRHIDQSSPMVDARLPDGSRVNAIVPPLSLVGPTITIRKFKKDALTVDDLIAYGSITQDVADFLQACVASRLNIIVSGGTGSGKTTLLNIISSFIPHDERIVTIEDAAELRLRQPHIVRLESRPANIEGKGAITIRDLFVNTLRMRPDRIIVGECRSSEALDMLQAMNTGHDGSLTTIHSNGPRDTLTRIETMVMMAGMELPLPAIRQQVSSAVDLIVHVARMRDHSRRVVAVAEVLGMEEDTVIMQDIFKFEQEGMDEDGRIIGQLQPTGIRPHVYERLVVAGQKVPLSMFGSIF